MSSCSTKTSKEASYTINHICCHTRVELMSQNFSSLFLKPEDAHALWSPSTFPLEVLIFRTAVYLPLNIKSQRGLSD